MPIIDVSRGRRQVGEQAPCRRASVGDLFEEGWPHDDHPIALLDEGRRLREMALAGARRAEEEDVFPLLDEARRGQLEDEGAVELLVEGEIKAIERAVGVAEARLGVAAGKEPVLAALQLVTHERGHEVEWGEALGLGLVQPRLEDGGHAGEAEFAEGGVDFDEVHEQSPVLRSMSSR
jgi:hypothetical protein